MNTLFWGPPAWKFLFSVANKYKVKNKESYHKFYNSLKHVLPCIYCRDSYAKFITELPIKNFLSSRKKLMYWLYLIHNKVNDKLRTQGYHSCKNPTFESIYKKYSKIKFLEKDTWIFLYCVAFNYVSDKKRHYKIFFENLKYHFPDGHYRRKYSSYLDNNPINLKDMEKLVKWCVNLCNTIGNVKTCNYYKLCKKFEKQRAGCSKTKGICRN